MKRNGRLNYMPLGLADTFVRLLAATTKNMIVKMENITELTLFARIRAGIRRLFASRLRKWAVNDVRAPNPKG